MADTDPELLVFSRRKVVQDGEREEHIRALFGLDQPEGACRHGIDAVLNPGGVPFEIKTTTKGSVSTARDFSDRTIAKWQDQYWLIGSGENTHHGFVYEAFRFLAPVHMAAWFERFRAKFRDKRAVHERMLATLAASGDYTRPQIEAVARDLARGRTENDPQINVTDMLEGRVIDVVGKPPEELRETLHGLVLRYRTPPRKQDAWLDVHPGAEYFRFPETE